MNIVIYIFAAIGFLNTVGIFIFVCLVLVYLRQEAVLDQWAKKDREFVDPELVEVCSWCQGPEPQGKVVTHGICKGCAEKFKTETAAMRVDGLQPVRTKKTKIERQEMTITKEQSKEMLEAAKPLIKWLNENCHPHCEATVSTVDVELMEGVARETTREFVRG